MFDKGSFNEGCNVEKSATNIKHPFPSTNLNYHEIVVKMIFWTFP